MGEKLIMSKKKCERCKKEIEHNGICQECVDEQILESDSGK